MLDEAAFLTLEFQDGAKFRWRIPRKYAWKLFLERWAPRQKEEAKEEPKEEFKEETVEDPLDGKFKLW